MLQRPPLLARDFALPIFVAALLFFPKLGETPFRRAEIYFADAARAMVEGGDWVIPHFRGQPFFDKPPLSYWAVGASFKLFGFSIAAARIVPAIAALLVIAATILLGWLLWKDRRTALYSGWILVSTIPFITFARIAMSDMLLVLGSTLAVLLAVFYYRSDRPPSFLVVVLAGVLGAGFLNKGPIALVVPGFALLCLIWEHWERRPKLSPATLLSAALVFFVIALGWFGAVYLRMGIEPLRFFFIRENLQRFSGDAHDVGKPLWFYLVTYLGQGAPWSVFLPFAASLFLRRQFDSSVRTLILWIVLVVSLLSLSQGKLDYYLLPLYPAVALILGRYFQTIAWSRAERFLASSVLVILGSALLLLPVLILRVPSGWKPQGLALAGVIGVLLGTGLWSLLAVIRFRPHRVLPALVIATSVAYGIANVSILPSYYSGQPNDALMAAATRERMLQPALIVATHGDPTQLHRDLLFHLRLVIEESNDLRKLAQSSRPYLLLAEMDEAERLKSSTRVREVGSYPYLPQEVFTLRGVITPPAPRRLVLLANFGF
jgi:4-amino-4-deoxy-L-arabinose transferase-like glycosyltransferase